MRRIVACWLAGWLAGLMAAGLVAASEAAPVAPLEFDGARLGMSLEQWKALPPPGPKGGRDASVCAKSAQGALACSYAARYGSFILPEPVSLEGHYLARRAAYDFVGGKLACIEFRSSVDAFNVLMARMKAQYGAPTRTMRDSIEAAGVELPRVRVAWDLPAGHVLLTDPSSNPDRLMVQLTVNGGAGACSPA